MGGQWAIKTWAKGVVRGCTGIPHHAIGAQTCPIRKPMKYEEFSQNTFSLLWQFHAACCGYNWLNEGVTAMRDHLDPQAWSWGVTLGRRRRDGWMIRWLRRCRLDVVDQASDRLPYPSTARPRCRTSATNRAQQVDAWSGRSSPGTSVGWLDQRGACSHARRLSVSAGRCWGKASAGVRRGSAAPLPSILVLCVQTSLHSSTGPWRETAPMRIKMGALCIFPYTLASRLWRLLSRLCLLC